MQNQPVFLRKITCNSFNCASMLAVSLALCPSMYESVIRFGVLVTPGMKGVPGIVSNPNDSPALDAVVSL